MAKTTVPVLIDGRFTGRGLDAARAVQTGVTYDVCSPDFGADPTGRRDSTKAIQDAVDRAYAAGGGTVRIPAGVYVVSFPFISLKGNVQVVGDGRATQIVASERDMTGTKTGVFHTGTWAERAQDPTLIHFGVSNLMIRAREAARGHKSYIIRLCGVLLNTDLGDNPVEPDAAPTLNNITVWDMETGVAILGRDDQAMDVWNLKIRNCAQAGLVVGKPDGHPELEAKVPGGPGGADNQFFGLNVGGANQGNLNYAGVEIYTSQCAFVNARVWYTHRSTRWQELYGQPIDAPAGADVTGGSPKTLDRERQKAGAGFYVKGTKCIFTGCLAQENGGHGFLIRWGQNQLIGCRAESSSYKDTTHSPAGEGDAADFYIANEGTDGTVLIGCLSQKVGNRGTGAKWSYYVETWYKGLLIQGCRSIDIAAPAGYAAPVRVDKSPQGDNVYVQVDKFEFSTRPGGTLENLVKRVAALEAAKPQ
jgi:tat pathway signal sequence domain protein|nr:MAG TPA: peptidase [Caudoviricetes sp.]